MNDTDADEVFTVLLLRLALLGLFLTLFRRTLLLVLLDIGSELGLPETALAIMGPKAKM